MNDIKRAKAKELLFKYKGALDWEDKFTAISMYDDPHAKDYAAKAAEYAKEADAYYNEIMSLIDDPLPMKLYEWSINIKSLGHGIVVVVALSIEDARQLIINSHHYDSDVIETIMDSNPTEKLLPAHTSYSYPCEEE